MTANLPPQLVRLFAPRPPIPFLPPTDKPFENRTKLKLSGLASVLHQCLDHDLEYVPTLSGPEMRKKRLEENKRKNIEKINEMKKEWNPTLDENASGTDPYRTLFISRLSFDTTEKKLEREFSYYGPVSRVSIVKDKITSKSKGYAFIEFEKEADMESAIKASANLRIDGRHVIVDVERGRTVKDWIPRRLGGGLGGYKVITKFKPMPIERSGRFSQRPGRGRFNDRDRSSRFNKPYDRPSRGRGGYRSESQRHQPYGERMAPSYASRPAPPPAMPPVSTLLMKPPSDRPAPPSSSRPAPPSDRPAPPFSRPPPPSDRPAPPDRPRVDYSSYDRHRDEDRSRKRSYHDYDRPRDDRRENRFDDYERPRDDRRDDRRDGRRDERRNERRDDRRESRY